MDLIQCETIASSIFLRIFFRSEGKWSRSNSFGSEEAALAPPDSSAWSNMPVRYFRLTEVPSEVFPVHEQSGVSWSWKTFFSYAGPGFLVASNSICFIYIYFYYLLLVAYLDPGNLEADLQVLL